MTSLTFASFQEVLEIIRSKKKIASVSDNIVGKTNRVSIEAQLFIFTHSLSRVVVPATLDSISVNAHFTRFL